MGRIDSLSRVNRPGAKRPGTWRMRFQPVKCNMMTLSRKKKTIENKYTMYSERHRTGIPNINKISWSEHHERLTLGETHRGNM